MGLGSSLFASTPSSSSKNSASDSTTSKAYTPRTIIIDPEDDEDADEDIHDLRQQFHNTVRENVVRFINYCVKKNNYFIFSTFFCNYYRYSSCSFSHCA
jgi:hypothetical protein